MTGTEAKRFLGLDAIRFVCAFVVVMSHSPSLLPFAGGSRTGLLLAKLIRDLFNGPAAVIVFFVISGFCIHWPNRDGRPLGADYFVRRYMRIGVPLIAALAMASFVHVDIIDGVVWSLYCELAYYTVYPVLRWLAERFGWLRLTAAAFCVGLAVALLHPERYGNYASANVLTNALLGLPCWLMGCVIAVSEIPSARSRARIWSWRAAVFASSIVVLELRFHTRFHFDLTLNFFGILVAFWIVRELGYGRSFTPWSWLERAGVWSYSLYLFHPAAGHIPELLFPKASYLLLWLVRWPIVFGSSYGFYRLFERPSHQLARSIAAGLRAKKVAAS